MLELFFHTILITGLETVDELLQTQSKGFDEGNDVSKDAGELLIISLVFHSVAPPFR